MTLFSTSIYEHLDLMTTPVRQADGLKSRVVPKEPIEQRRLELPAGLVLATPCSWTVPYPGALSGSARLWSWAIHRWVVMLFHNHHYSVIGPVAQFACSGAICQFSVKVVNEPGTLGNQKQRACRVNWLGFRCSHLITISREDHILHLSCQIGLILWWTDCSYRYINQMDSHPLVCRVNSLKMLAGRTCIWTIVRDP